MRRVRRFLVYPILLLVGLATIAVGVGFMILQSSLPDMTGQAVVKKLTAPVTIEFDQYGIPVIHANTRLDAVHALGYSSARDRLFQMDLMRRKNAGRLAELFGQAVIDSDISVRTYGFHRVAKRVVEKMPPGHKQYLEAYAEGVNSFIDNTKALPFEFTVLGYRPEPWKAEDSILVVLGMFDILTAWSEQEERMLTVMEKSLPAEILAFLTPDTDQFTDTLTGAASSLRPARLIPVAALEKTLAQRSPDTLKMADAVELRDFVVGSNAWAVSGAKTRDGRAILANDMHLGISVPNLWYRCEMNYGSVHVAGVTLPGTPVFVAGSNGHIAWGSTNLTGDFLDLVSLEVNPENPDEYKVADKWQRFEHNRESIRAKDAEIHILDVRQTIWGPVAKDPLLGKPVAIHWTALDDEVVDIRLMDLEQTETLDKAVEIANRIGGPQLNFLLADNSGHIAWTIMGRIPIRKGIDGSVSRSWADGTIGWDGYVDAQRLPREINPPGGILVSANNRRLGKEYPYVIGHEFVNGYRAYRITQQLKQMQEINEWSMFELQLDTENEFYAYYQKLALTVLSPKAIQQHPELQELREHLLAWNGRADTDSLGLALLELFRENLAETVFSPFLEASRKIDKNFRYSWLYIDTPLQAMLTEKIPGLLPDPDKYRNWDDFILAQLKQSAKQLKEAYPDTNLSELTWGKINTAQFAHPFSAAMPFLSLFLDMPKDQLAGCGGCVRAAGPDFGASERLVVSPAHLDEGILHMPGGQSAHPLSPNYQDQQSYWVQGLPIELLAGTPKHTLVLKPETK
ncbi:MAG: penicillin acylase family protein [Methyloglobulus sp.]|nr:penicillin acylase family protein [Methyloglobulus sp.]